MNSEIILYFQIVKILSAYNGNLKRRGKCPKTLRILNLEMQTLRGIRKNRIEQSQKDIQIDFKIRTQQFFVIETVSNFSFQHL